MSEVIEGVVKKIIGGEIVEIEISNVGRDNIFDYLKNEKIIIHSHDPSKQSSTSNNSIKSYLDLEVSDQIKCYVKSRDLRGNILGKVVRVN